ncbi:MAG TPA: hypothetical protein VFV75_03210 [Candidatus Polarisedimenticolaceae bacterium]|nr:hypothetical protein [Candidatus Polarisedimenticolaceae bacterium]
MRTRRIAIASILTLSLHSAASAAAMVFEAAGPTAADIQAAVDDFRDFLGPLNPNAIGSFPSGRREINWDGVPDVFAAPNALPAGFFNANSPRGVVFFTPGTGFQVSADSANPTNTPILFGNLQPAFPLRFRAFSPERLFTALGSNIVETLFFVPGSTEAATVTGFGVVFTDVNRADSTKIEFLNARGNVFFSKDVLPGGARLGTFSFLGVSFDAGERAYMVRITSGNRAPRAPLRDVVMMDDFIYAEPQPLD